MDNIFKELNNNCLVYIDDILKFSRSIERHRMDIKIITKKCEENEIVLGEKKCVYVQKELEFLKLEIKAWSIKM